MSPRPTKSVGKSSRSPKMASSTSPYFPEATLPSRTDLAAFLRKRAGFALERHSVAGVARVHRDPGHRAPVYAVRPPLTRNPALR